MEMLVMVLLTIAQGHRAKMLYAKILYEDAVGK